MAGLTENMIVPPLSPRYSNTPQESSSGSLKLPSHLTQYGLNPNEVLLYSSDPSLYSASNPLKTRTSSPGLRSGLGSSIASIIASPITGGVTSIPGLVGSAYFAYQSEKRQEEIDKENQRRYEEAIATEKARYEAQQKMAERTLKMSAAQYRAEQRRLARQEAINAEGRNFDRSQYFINRLQQLGDLGYSKKVNFLNLVKARG